MHDVSLITLSLLCSGYGSALTNAPGIGPGGGRGGRGGNPNNCGQHGFGGGGGSFIGEGQWGSEDLVRCQAENAAGGGGTKPGYRYEESPWWSDYPAMGSGGGTMDLLTARPSLGPVWYPGSDPAPPTSAV